MGSTKAISLILTLIVVGGIGWYGVSQYNGGDTNDATMRQEDFRSGTDQMKTEGSDEAMTNEQDDAMMKDSTSTMEGDTMMKGEASTTVKAGADVMMESDATAH